MKQTIDLPWPPSVNHYWRHVGNKVLISKEGRAFRKDVALLVFVRRLKMMAGRLKVLLEAFPPDRRERDLDNLQKSTLDSLQKARVYESDSQIDDLHIVRCDLFRGGMIRVHLEEIET